MITVNGKGLARVLAVAGQFRRERAGRTGVGAGGERAGQVRLTVDGDTLLVRASSQGSEAQLPVRAQQEDLWGGERFDVLVDLNTVQHFARRAEALGLSVAGETLHLTAGASVMDLPTGELPLDAPWPELEAVGTIRADRLLAALLHVRGARPEVGSSAASMLSAWRGVLLDGNGSALRVVAGSSFGVAIQAAPYSGEVTRLLLPPGELGGVTALLAGEGDAEVTLRADAAGTRCEVRGAAGRVRLQLLDHLSFPQYQQVIPQAHDFTVRLDGATLRRALRQVQPLAETERRSVGLTVTGGRVTLEGRSEYGSARAELEAETDGEGQATFSLPLLSSLLSVDGMVSLRMSPARPALLVQGAYCAVFSPMRLN